MGKAARHLLQRGGAQARAARRTTSGSTSARATRPMPPSAVQIGDPIVMAAPPVELRGAAARLARARQPPRRARRARGRAARRSGRRPAAPRSSRWRRCARRPRTRARAPRCFAVEPDVAITLDVHAHRRLPEHRPGARDRLARARLGAVHLARRGAARGRRAAAHRGRARGRHPVHAGGRRQRVLDRQRGRAGGARRACRAGSSAFRCATCTRPSETCDLRDVELAIELVARFCRSLRPGEDWTQ